MIAAAPAWAGEPVVIPNGSFELPATAFVSINFNSWQKPPKPDWYVEGGGYLWNQLTGVFKNTAAGQPDHLVNCDGNQAVWLFAVPEVELFQDYDTVASNQTTPSHGFDARFEVGKAYDLTVAVNGGGGNMLEGAPLELGLYFRDAEGRRVGVAATTVTNSLEAFPVHTRFVDYQVRLPTVQAGDAWAGQHIGVRFLSTVSPEMQGGYWDLDDVRLTATADPKFSVAVESTDSGVRLSWPSVTGFLYQVESSEDFHTWSGYGTLLAGTGDELAEPVPSLGSRSFFRVRATAAP